MRVGPVEAYLDTAQLLWPQGHRPRLVSTQTDEAGPVLLVVPSARRPRLAVPAGHAGAAATALLRFSDALSTRDRLVRLAAAGALRLGLHRFVRDRIVLGSSAGSLEEALSTRHGTDVLCSITLGPPRVNRKPVLQLFTTEGHGFGYAKVGITALLSDHVRQEHRTLARLADTRLPDTLRVPGVVDFFEWNGAPILVVSQLPTSAAPRRTPTARELSPLMVDFARSFAEGNRTLPGLPAWDRTMSAAADRGDDDLTASHRALEEQVGHLPLEIGGWHGDWSPWNMSHARGRLSLWDWERFETGVPIGIDVPHYALSSAFRARSPTVELAERSLRGAGWWGPDLSGEGRAALGVYLALIIERYHMFGPPQRELAARVDVLRRLYADLVGRR